MQLITELVTELGAGVALVVMIVYAVWLVGLTLLTFSQAHRLRETARDRSEPSDGLDHGQLSLEDLAEFEEGSSSAQMSGRPYEDDPLPSADPGAGLVLSRPSPGRRRS